jgi:hypothetical protein
VQTAKNEKHGREHLQRIIDMCKAIESHAVDPFTLNVEDILKIVQQYFPDWKKTEDLNLDAEVIHHLATVIKLQSEWVKHRSTSLYSDPFLLEEKITTTPKDDMVTIFLRSWHPIVELEQINLHSLAEALRYWDSLVPLSERWQEFGVNEVATGTTTRDELVKLRILGDKVFGEELEAFWQELKLKVQEIGKDGKILYWNFVGADSYEDTVQRAFMTSFLITYGYATLEINRLEETIFIKPFEKPLAKLGTQQGVSVPIAVTYENWQKWKRGELD